MRIENGIYYTDEELSITNIYEVVKQGFEEALNLAVMGKVKGFAAVGFDKKYGWNGSMYYELINLDYQDLSEYNPDEEEQMTEDTADAVDVDALRAENEQLKTELEQIKPFADKYTTYAEVIELIEQLKDTSEEKLVGEIERFKQVFAQIAEDAQTILRRIE